jgi:hypothetical protein
MKKTHSPDDSLGKALNRVFTEEMNRLKKRHDREWAETTWHASDTTELKRRAAEIQRLCWRTAALFKELLTSANGIRNWVSAEVCRGSNSVLRLDRQYPGLTLFETRAGNNKDDAFREAVILDFGVDHWKTLRSKKGRDRGWTLDPKQTVVGVYRHQRRVIGDIWEETDIPTDKRITQFLRRLLTKRGRKRLEAAAKLLARAIESE